MIDRNTLEQLNSAACEAAGRAYMPYSNFPVGAAVLTGACEIYSGCNVENVSYGLTICAERNAIFTAIGQGARKIAAVVVYTPTATPTLPCGACRQVIAEFGMDAAVVCFCDGGETFEGSVRDLLPRAFGER